MHGVSCCLNSTCYRHRQFTGAWLPVQRTHPHTYHIPHPPHTHRMPASLPSSLHAHCTPDLTIAHTQHIPLSASCLPHPSSLHACRILALFRTSTLCLYCAPPPAHLTYTMHQPHPCPPTPHGHASLPSYPHAHRIFASIPHICPIRFTCTEFSPSPACTPPPCPLPGMCALYLQRHLYPCPLPHMNTTSLPSPRMCTACPPPCPYYFPLLFMRITSLIPHTHAHCMLDLLFACTSYPSPRSYCIRALFQTSVHP